MYNVFELTVPCYATGEWLQLSYLLNISSFVYPQEEPAFALNIFPYDKDLPTKEVAV